MKHPTTEDLMMDGGRMTAHGFVGGVAELADWVARHLTRPISPTCGSLRGLDAKRFIDDLEFVEECWGGRPLWHRSSGVLIAEVVCTESEEEEVIARTGPVDFARFPENGSTLFIWYAAEKLNPGETLEDWRDVYRRVRRSR
jgi:hypothetical protein